MLSMPGISSIQLANSTNRKIVAMIGKMRRACLPATLTLNPYNRSIRISNRFCDPRGTSASGDPRRILRVAATANRMMMTSAINVAIKVFVILKSPMASPGTGSAGSVMVGKFPSLPKVPVRLHKPTKTAM